MGKVNGVVVLDFGVMPPRMGLPKPRSPRHGREHVDVKADVICKRKKEFRKSKKSNRVIKQKIKKQKSKKAWRPPLMS